MFWISTNKINVKLNKNFFFTSKSQKERKEKWNHSVLWEEGQMENVVTHSWYIFYSHLLNLMRDILTFYFLLKNVSFLVFLRQHHRALSINKIR